MAGFYLKNPCLIVEENFFYNFFKKNFEKNAVAARRGALRAILGPFRWGAGLFVASNAYFNSFLV